MKMQAPCLLVSFSCLTSVLQLNAFAKRGNADWPNRPVTAKVMRVLASVRWVVVRANLDL